MADEQARETITNLITDFAVNLRFDDLCQSVIADAKRGLLDTLGVTLAGAAERASRRVCDAAMIGSAGGDVTVLGTVVTASAGTAALTGGYAAHLLDYDDSQLEVGTHLSAPIVPTVLAVAELLRSSGKDVICGYVAGFEVGCRLGRVSDFGRILARRGVHATGYLGHLGAAAAAGKLLGLDRRQTVNCLGIAAGQASGLMKAIGTMSKALSSGTASRNGVLAALLAQRDFTGADQVLDSEQSIFAIFNVEPDHNELARGLGDYFEISHNTLKCYACAGWRNPVVEGVSLIAAENDLRAQDVKSIVVTGSSHPSRLPNYPDPKTGLEAKFSTEHCAAVALIDRAGGLSQFSDARACASDVAELRQRTTVQFDASLGKYQIRIELSTVDGRKLTKFLPVQRGDYNNPMTNEEIEAKFRANASVVLGHDSISKLIKIINGLESVQDITQLASLCRPIPVRPDQSTVS